MLLIDTDVLIDYLRGFKKAANYLEETTDPLLLSSITLAELYAGVKGKEERDVLKNFLRLFKVMPVDHHVAELGGNFRNDFGKSHGTGLADALIAATAVTHRANLVTLNKKHFPMVDDVIVPYKK